MKIKLSQFEKDVFGPLLESASDELSNHSCNDYPISVTDENRKDLLAFIADFTDGDEDEREHLSQQVETEDVVYFADWMLIDYLYHKLMNA